jgi:hypothetical protein
MIQLAKARTAKNRRLTSYDDIFDNIQIYDKHMELVPFIPNRAQRHLMGNLTGRDIILKARRLGFSTLIRAMHESKAMTKTAGLATLAHDSKTTSTLRRMSRTMWQNLPSNLKPNRSADNANTTIYENTNSFVIIQPATADGGRGEGLTDIHGSEVAMWKYAKETLAGIMQAVPIGGNVILESTPRGASGWFYDTCMEALDGNSIWTLHFYEWWWDADYQIPLDDGEILDYTDDELLLITKHNLSPEQIKWRRYKIKEIPHTFLQEYPEDVHSCFLTSGNSFFGSIDHAFTAPLDIKHNDEHRYVAGLDFGQSNDFTVMIVIDTFTSQQVDMLRVNKLQWGDIRHQVKQMYNKWDVSLLIAEKNSIGSVNIEELRKDGLNVKPFNTTARSKPALIQTLYAGLHEQGLTLQADSPLKHELQNFISKQTPSGAWAYEGANGSHDDCVIALALAWFAVVRGQNTIGAV